MSGLLGVSVLQSSQGYHLIPPVLTQIQSISKNVNQAQTQLKQTDQKLSTVAAGLNTLVSHINDDVNTYNHILPQLQSLQGSEGSEGSEGSGGGN